LWKYFVKLNSKYKALGPKSVIFRCCLGWYSEDSTVVISQSLCLGGWAQAFTLWGCLMGAISCHVNNGFLEAAGYAHLTLPLLCLNTLGRSWLFPPKSRRNWALIEGLFFLTFRGNLASTTQPINKHKGSYCFQKLDLLLLLLLQCWGLSTGPHTC
jgi:hypothetical protein